jgi:hypothetical protein
MSFHFSNHSPSFSTQSKHFFPFKKHFYQFPYFPFFSNKFIISFQIADFSDMFVGRLITEVPDSIKELASSLLDKTILELDLSHNAFGPAGVSAFDFLLKQNKTIKTLKINNNGLGPVLNHFILFFL